MKLIVAGVLILVAVVVVVRVWREFLDPHELDPHGSDEDLLDVEEWEEETGRKWGER